MPGSCGWRNSILRRHSGSRGFTLVEVLVATALTLLVMAATVTLFGSVTEGIAGSRAIIETVDRLRGTKERLTLDLRGITAPMLPPLKPEWGLGYFEYKEGAVGGSSVDAFGAPDTTVSDSDDVLMFTTRSTTDPFIGRFGTGVNATARSQVAEVAWFVRGTTLYRRVLLVLPNVTIPTAAGYYANYDVSAHQIGGTLEVDDLNGLAATLVPNSLADLTKRENRYGHAPRRTGVALYGYPHGTAWGQLGLPTLRECSDSAWQFPYFGGTAFTPTVPATVASIDYWNNPHPWTGVDNLTGTLSPYMNGTRIAEDVILTNVIGFDVRAWDPGAPVRDAGSTVTVPGDADYGTQSIVGYGAYVNLGWNTGYSEAAGAPTSLFHDNGQLATLPQVYDTWSTHYEHDGVNQDGDGLTDEATNGADDDGNAGVDDPAEREAPPPYPFPLRGIQVKIRVYEPDSRQIREVTVVQDFLPE